jgi:hypothetical protein
MHENQKTRCASTGVAAFLLVSMLVLASGCNRSDSSGGGDGSRGIVTHDGEANAASQLLGHYYALAIGINDYKHLPRLKTAVHDAESMAATLHDRYGFQTVLLRDATRDQITHALNDYRKDLDENSSLLIYYAGHGSYDKEADKAYWLPVDADRGDTTDWIMADDITTQVKVIPARHILIISDSCYSGGITRDASPAFTPSEQNRYLEKMIAGKSRTLMASGALEPVSDQGAGGHSVFADALLKGLNQTSDPVFSAATLFDSYIRVSVAGRSEQSPQYNPIRNSGHDFGDFVFVRNGATLPTSADNALSEPSLSRSNLGEATPDEGSRGGGGGSGGESRSKAYAPPTPASGGGKGARGSIPASSLVGCWSWVNNSAAIFRSDGTVADGPFVAQWRLADASRQIYTITWPKAVDSVTLSADRSRVSGANQYGYPVSWTRVAGGIGDPMVGVWHASNGQNITVRGDGTISAGTLSAQWKAVNPMARSYNFVWPQPVDTLKLSADGLHLSGGNQYGVKTGGTKVAAVCPGAN